MWGRRTKARKEKDVEMVRIDLTRDRRFVDVPREELVKDAWGRVHTAEGQDYIKCDDYFACVFGYYALWLHDLPLHPYQELSQLYDAAAAASNAYASPGMNWYPPPDAMNIAQMSQATHDLNPSMLCRARKLVLAYFLGQDMGATHFQDAVMNEIARSFCPDLPLAITFVQDIYARYSSRHGFLGLKKFLVDYYVWGSIPASDSDEPKICKFSGLPPQSIQSAFSYPVGFYMDVQDTVTRVHGGNDVVVDFTQTWDFLSEAYGGSQRCRYHQHTGGEMCFNLIAGPRKE